MTTHKSFFIKLGVFVALSTFCIQGIVSALAPKDAVTVKLISDKTQVELGGDLYVGVYFNLKPGWHIYGKERGETGLPTRIIITLPNGFKKSQFIWPEETAFNLPGGVKAHGYEGEVVIAQELQVPAVVDSGQKITITADIDWLLCSDKVCIPGKTTQEMTISIGTDISSAQKKLFKELYL